MYKIRIHNLTAQILEEKEAERAMKFFVKKEDEVIEIAEESEFYTHIGDLNGGEIIDKIKDLDDAPYTEDDEDTLSIIKDLNKAMNELISIQPDSFELHYYKAILTAWSIEPLFNSITNNLDDGFINLENISKSYSDLKHPFEISLAHFNRSMTLSSNLFKANKFREYYLGIIKRDVSRLYGVDFFWKKTCSTHIKKEMFTEEQIYMPLRKACQIRVNQFRQHPFYDELVAYDAVSELMNLMIMDPFSNKQDIGEYMLAAANFYSGNEPFIFNNNLRALSGIKGLEAVLKKTEM